MSISKKYAKFCANKFCEERFPSEYVERPRTFSLGKFSVLNGESAFDPSVNGESAFDPSETWPAQVEDFIWDISISKNKSISYENMKSVLLENKPEIVKKSYVNFEEYKNTIETLFEGTLFGLKKGKFEEEYLDNYRSFSERTPIWKKPFVDFQKKALEKNNLGLRIGWFEEKVPSYYNFIVCQPKKI